MDIDTILDNHMHLRKDGRFLSAVKEFCRYGGTHLIMSSYPDPSIVLKEKSYVKLYKRTIDVAKEVMNKIKVKIFVTIGPYPVDYLYLKERIGREKARKLMMEGMEEAGRFCLENDICIAIGEIGRPHFRVDSHTFQDINDIMIHGFEVAKDYDIPVVLHTEKTTPELCREIAEIADKVNMPRGKIIKHFSPPLIDEKENHGLIPSVLSTWKNLKEAISKGDRFLMETDYIDDPKRPGAVLSLKTIPIYTKRLLDKGFADEESLYRIHKDLPEKIYGVDIS